MDQQENGNTYKKTVTILVPQHSSAHLDHPPKEEANVLSIQFYRSGALWRGVAPILLEAPNAISERLLQLLILSSKVRSNQGSVAASLDPRTDKDMEESQFPGFHYRTLCLANETAPLTSNSVIYLIPPTAVNPEPIFTSLVVRVEHSLIRLQTLTAVQATLGGGYFFCRRLAYSLALARQQRMVALRIGNTNMVRQCSINESYNLIYAGHFQEAYAVLKELEESSEDDPVTQRQCQAARLLARRLKKVAKRLERYHALEKHHATEDDYQKNTNR